eukprot:TRINITY_DN2592_c0_g1_i1.p1 TRINITY_DN2592_c0_g1~~TRINITY_DN2592_c0_g1_i1.p1  ORF type:complete len:365 (+),score=119.53 TRINITY_DN2592_c0_g1_i1:38-1096(+)
MSSFLGLIFVGTYEGNLIGLNTEFDEKENKYSMKKLFIEEIGSTIKRMNMTSKHLITSSADEHLRVFDVNKLQKGEELTYHNSTVNAIDFFSDTYMVSGDDNGTCLLTSLDDFNVYHRMNMKDPIVGLTFHPTGRLMLGLTNKGHVYLFNMLNGRLAAKHTLDLTTVQKNKTLVPYSIEFSPLGDFYCVNLMFRIIVCETATSEIIFDCHLKDQVWSTCWIDSNRLLLGNRMGKFILCNTETNGMKSLNIGYEDKNRIQAISRVQDPVEDGELFVAGTSNGDILLFNIDEEGHATFLAETKTQGRLTTLIGRHIRLNLAIATEDYESDAEEEFEDYDEDDAMLEEDEGEELN